MKCSLCANDFQSKRAEKLHKKQVRRELRKARIKLPPQVSLATFRLSFCPRCSDAVFGKGQVKGRGGNCFMCGKPKEGFVLYQGRKESVCKKCANFIAYMLHEQGVTVLFVENGKPQALVIPRWGKE